MDISQENMDMSFASSQNSNAYPVHPQSLQHGYLNYDRQRREGAERRQVRIRNPHYITPGASRTPISYAHHHYSANDPYSQASAQVPSVESANQSSFSATPRRGPWRYMEVNDQWIPENDLLQNTSNVYPSNTPSEDMLSDEFEGFGGDLVAEQERRNLERMQQHERHNIGYMPSRCIARREINHPPQTSSYSHPTTALQCIRESTIVGQQHQLVPQQMLHACPSPRISNAINRSPKRPVHSFNVGRYGFGSTSPSTHSSHYPNRNSSAIQGMCEGAETVNTSTENIEDSFTNEQISRNATNNFSSSSKKDFSMLQHIQSKSPIKKKFSNLPHSPRGESIIHDPILRNNEQTVGCCSELLSVSPQSPASPLRNSTPFLHRPRALFQTAHPERASRKILANKMSLVSKPNEEEQIVYRSCETRHVSSSPKLNTSTLIKSPGEIRAKRHNTKQVSTTKKSPNTERRTMETEVDPVSSDAHVELTKSKSHSFKRSQKPTIQKELNSLLSSNSFHGYIDENYLNKERQLRSVTCKSKSVFNNDVMPKIRKCANSFLRRDMTHSNKEKGKLIKIPVDSVHLQDENCTTEYLKKAISTVHKEPTDGVFKIPLPPSTRSKANASKEKYQLHEKFQNLDDISSDDNSITDERTEFYLKNWLPKLKGKKLLVEGDLLDFGNVNPNKGRYLTSKVIERVTSTIIKTKKRHYILEGKLSAADAVKYETPSFILNSFSAGVPEKWEVYRDQWRKFVKEQRHNLFGSGASLSSWSSASSFDQASGFLSNTRNSIHLGQSNKNKVGDGTFTNGSSIMTSSTDDISRVLGHEKSPIKYSWEYLAEGKKARLKSYDTSTLNEGPTKALPNENLKNDKNASNGKNNQSSTVTSVEDINFSANSTSRRKGLRKTNINNNTSNKLSSSQTRESAKIHPVNVSMSPTTRSVPNEPKFVKELFVIVKNDNRYKKSKVGRCIVCSATYSIPYIERHITDKHASFVLDSNSSKISTNSHSIQRSSTRSNYLRPRVVITRLGSKDTINTSGKAVTPHVSKMKLNVTKSKNNTSQINNIESSRKRTCTPNVETNERQGVRKHSPQYQKNKSTKSHSNAQKKSRNINLPMNDSMNMQKNRFCGKTSKPSKSNKNYATKRSDSEFKQNRPIQNRQTKTDKECKNQAKTDSVSKKVNKEPEANLRQMVIQPITIKDRQTNTRVLNALNKNHKDDIFLCNKWKKTDTAKDAKQGPNDILADLFDSDSENDLSLHSARTPIGRFFDRSESKTPAHNLDNPEEDIYLTCGKKDEFQQDAFINRKVKETRIRGRLTSAFSSNNANILQSFTKSSRNLVEQQSNDLVKPISNLLAQDENAPDDTDEEMESYFSEEPSTFTRSIADPPSGLIDMFNKEKAKRQQFSSIRRNY